MAAVGGRRGGGHRRRRSPSRSTRRRAPRCAGRSTRRCASAPSRSPSAAAAARRRRRRAARSGGDVDRDRRRRKPFGDAAGNVQFVSPQGTSSARPRRPPRGCPSTSAHAAARGLRGRAATTPTRTSRACTCACSPSGRGDARRGAGRAPADRGRRRRCDQLLLILLAVGGGGILVAAVLGGVVARAALAPVARFTRRTEALTANPDLSQRLEVEGERRARAPRPQLQRDAGRARAVGRGAAPPRRRREPRAAHADREPARQHPGAARTPTACPRRSARACAPTSSRSSTS